MTLITYMWLQFMTISLLTSIATGDELTVTTETGHELIVMEPRVSNEWMVQPVQCKLIVIGPVRSVQS